MQAIHKDSRAHIEALIERVDAQFRLAAKAWITGNNSGNSETARLQDARCDQWRRKAESELAPLGIQVDYPGLYPSFRVNGFDEYTTKAAVLSAIGKPRNWIK